MNPDRWIASGRAALATHVAGSGDPVAFLHANVCDSRMWRAQMEAVGTGNRVIAYDRRGFGRTRAGREEFSALGDLMAVLDGTAAGEPVVLVGCSRGGRLALDAALRHPSRVRGLVLIASSVNGAPDPTHSPGTAALMAQLDEAEASGDLDRVNAVEARLWLDGPLALEGRVGGPARDLFLDMNGIALRAPPVGPEVDPPPAFHRLDEVAAPCLVIWGDLDFPHVQERCRHVAATVRNGSGHEVTGTAHLPGLERPAEVTDLLASFIRRLPGHRG